MFKIPNILEKKKIQHKGGGLFSMNPVPLLSYKKVFIVKYLKNLFRPQCIKPDINIFGGKIFNFLLGMFYNVDGSEQEKNK